MIILVFFAPNQRTWKQTGNNNNRKNNKNKLKNKFIFGTLGFEAILSNCSMKINLQSVKEHNSILTSCVCSFFSFEISNVQGLEEWLRECRCVGMALIHTKTIVTDYSFINKAYRNKTTKKHKDQKLYLCTYFFGCVIVMLMHFSNTPPPHVFLLHSLLRLLWFQNGGTTKKHKSKLALQISKKPMKKKDSPGPNWEWNLMYFG